MRDEERLSGNVTSFLISHFSFLIPAFLFFAALAAAFLAPVLCGNRALLPTDFLMRMSPWAQILPSAPSGGPTRPELSWNPLLWDAIAQFYPWRAFTAHWMQRGIIPFWDPHQFCGTPFLANSQSAPLYPLHLLLLGVPGGLPVARAMALLAAIHLTLAGFLTYLWLRVMRLSPFAAALGGVTFMLSGFGVTWLELPSFLTVACWLPLLYLTVHRALESPTAPRAAAVAATLGLLLLGGHLQIAFYCLLGVGFYAFHQLWRRVRGKPDKVRTVLPFAFCLLPSAALGVMLAAPQLLPSIELSRHSHRMAAPSASGYAAYVGGAMPAVQLVRLFLPDFFGNPTHGHYDARSPADYTEFGAWIGGVGLLLALCGLLAWRRRPRETAPAALIAALALLLALGTPLNLLFYFGIPGFSQSGSPARVLVLFSFAAAWLAALGAEALIEGIEEGEGRVPETEPSADNMRLEPRVAEAELGGIPGTEDLGADAPSAALADLSEARAAPLPPTPRRRALAMTGQWLPLTALAIWLILLGAALLLAEAFVTSLGVDFGPFLARNGPALQLSVVLAILAIGVPAALKRLSRTGSVSASVSGVLSRGVLAVLLLGELWLYGAGFNPTGPLAEVYPSTPLIAALHSGPAAGTGRVLPLNHYWSLSAHPRALLPPNSALALGLSDPQGYDSLFIGRYKGFTNLLVPGGDSAPPQNGNMLFLWDSQSPLLPLLAADRVVSARYLGWALLYEQAGIRVYRNPTALPRAFVATSWRVERDDAVMARDLVGLAAARRLGMTALIEEPVAAGGAAGRGGPAAVQDVSPNDVRVSLSSGVAPGMLVLLDNYFPGWHAIDEATGRPLPIHRADLTFRGILVGEASRTIRLRYEPATFRLGLFLALLAVASIAAISLGTWGRGSTRSDGESLPR